MRVSRTLERVTANLWRGSLLPLDGVAVPCFLNKERGRFAPQRERARHCYGVPFD